MISLCALCLRWSSLQSLVKLSSNILKRFSDSPLDDDFKKFTVNSAESPQIITVGSQSVPYTPFETLWVPNSARLVVLGENPRRTGTISVYRLNLEDEKEETLSLRTKETKRSGFKCGTFGHSFDKKKDSSQRLATGDFEGTLNVWDLEKLNKPTFCVQNAHSKMINAIDGISGKHGAAEMVTGIV